MLSKAAEEVPGPFDADRSAPGLVLADIEGEQGLALLPDVGNEDRQVLVVSLAEEPVFRGDGVDQPELAELQDEVAGSGGRRRAGEKDVRVDKDADRPWLLCWQGLRGLASPYLGLRIQEVV
jgi:hypothetical protein